MRFRLVLPLCSMALFALGSSALAPMVPAQAAEIDPQAILHDPDAPVTGNPRGDVIIVAFSVAGSWSPTANGGSAARVERCAEK